jgi:transketolase
VTAVGGRGHIGPALSILEIIDVMYTKVMDSNLIAMQSPRRDRFLLSKGHGCLALYVVLEDLGLLGNLDLESFCRYDSAFGGHPESATHSAIEFSTGSLGHGLSVGVGMAKAAKMRNENWKVFVIMGDGELNEGSVWEAAAHASKHKLDNLTVVVDFNNMQASGPVNEILDMRPLSKKWEAFGFRTCEINGHDNQAIEESLVKSPDGFSPRCVIAYTVKGKGITQTENSSIWHHKAKISPEEIEELRAELRN